MLSPDQIDSLLSNVVAENLVSRVEASLVSIAQRASRFLRTFCCNAALFTVFPFRGIDNEFPCAEKIEPAFAKFEEPRGFVIDHDRDVSAMRMRGGEQRCNLRASP